MFKINDEFPLENLYSKEIKIKLKLLNILYRNPDGYTVEGLSDETSLAPKTIYKYIRNLNLLSDNHFGKHCINVSPDNRNYYFQGDKIKFLKLRFLILEDCESLQLLFALISNSSVNRYKFCSQYFLSDSTLKICIRAINILFEPMDIHLITRKNEIYLKGNEAIIRYCFSSLLWRTYNGLKWPFESLLNEQKILELIKSFYKDSESKISLGKQMLLMIQLGVGILRAKSSHLISVEELPIYTKALTTTILHSIEFEKALKKLFYINDTEIDFILLNLYLSPEQNKISSNNQLTLDVFKNFKAETYNSSVQFIKFIKEIHPDWDASSTKSEVFIAGVLSAHIATDIYKQACFNLQDLNMIQFISTEFPMLIPSLYNVIANLNPNMPKNILNALVFHLVKAYLLSFEPKDFEPEINILVITDSPKSVERGTIFQINSILRNKYNINISTDSSSFTSIDLIISTGLYLDLPKASHIIYVFPQIIERDAKAIRETCETVSKDKSRQIILNDIFSLWPGASSMKI